MDSSEIEGSVNPAPIGVEEVHNSLVPVQARAMAIFDPQAALAQVRKAVEFSHGLREILVEGEDYAKRPGYPKPSLEKPGAEKIAFALNCAPVIVRGEQGRVIDEEWGLKEYELVISLVNRSNGVSWAEGVGYSVADRKDCEVWDKATQGRLPKKERAAWANNKALKMAYKSGLICAALTGAALSGFFTQDLEGAPPPKEKPSALKPGAVERAAPGERHPNARGFPNPGNLERPIYLKSAMSWAFNHIPYFSQSEDSDGKRIPPGNMIATWLRETAGIGNPKWSTYLPEQLEHAWKTLKESFPMAAEEEAGMVTFEPPGEPEEA